MDFFKANRVPITPGMLARAKSKAQKTGQMNSKSFMKGEGNLVGFLGEEIFESELGKRLRLRKEDEHTHDYRWLVDGKELILDVKTKRTTCPYVKEEFEASVVSYQIDDKIQPVDFYVFCRIYFPRDGSDPPYGWILSKIKKADFLSRSKFLKKGEYDPSNDYYVRNDCYNMKYSDMGRFPDFGNKIGD